MVKAGKRGSAEPHDGASEPAHEACDAVLDEVDRLIMSIDCEPAPPPVHEEWPAEPEGPEEAASPGVPEGTQDPGAVPWLDRFETTSRLIDQLEETLRMMEERGVNLTNAWELATTARSLLDSADVVQALIYANRSFRMAQDVHRFPDSTGIAAS